MSDHKVLTTLSDAAYLNAPEYREHIEAVLASYDNPAGILGELVSQIADAFRFRRESFETIDRLIEQQLKNVRLLMQAYDSVRFAPQIHKKMVLEIEQLELQVKQSREDQRLEVDRQ